MSFQPKLPLSIWSVSNRPNAPVVQNIILTFQFKKTKGNRNGEVFDPWANCATSYPWQKRCLLSERVARVRVRGEEGGREAILRIVSPEDSNGFWCHVFFAQHLTHGAVQLQSLRFNAYYDEICQSNGLTIGLSDYPKWELIFKMSRFVFF